MDDVAVEIDNRPGALALLGEALGAAGISVEGGGVFGMGQRAIAHFLVGDGAHACRALGAAGIAAGARAVLLRRLDQTRPGQLGAIARRLADAGVNVEVMYSDHAGSLVLVVDDHQLGATVTAEWSW